MTRDSHYARTRRNQIKAAQIRFRKKYVAVHPNYTGHEIFKLNPLTGRYECPLCGKTREEIFNQVMNQADLQEMLANLY